MSSSTSGPAAGRASAPPAVRKALEREHSREAIRRRLAEPRSYSYLGDAVFGAVDGCVTTFAVVAGAVGGGFPSTVILVLGFANLLADGFSMAVGNYLGTKSEREKLENTRRTEQRHIDVVPEGEREELRQIFAAKGFKGDDLESIVQVISSNRDLWVETMLTWEHGMHIDARPPMGAALATFAAFFGVGLIPLLAFLVPGLDAGTRFTLSSVMTAVAFAAVGVAKGYVLERSTVRSALETLLTGGGAAFLAYAVGTWLRSVFGAA